MDHIGEGQLLSSQTEIVRTSYKGVELVVVAGDIIERLEFVDAMVIPSSPDLDRQMGAVENAVYRKFGEGPFDAVKDKKLKAGYDNNVQMGEAVGIEHRKKAFIFVNIQPEGDGYSQTAKGVETSAINCFTEANNLNCKSIIMPALGNGMWEVPLPISAGAIGNAVRTYVDNMNDKGLPQNLKRVEIIWLN
jgi:O-acetyl-ADP-ribose deacetylase (regulator of RNase III)